MTNMVSLKESASKDLVELNLNDHIYVKLKQAGIDHLNGYWTKYGGELLVKLNTNRYLRLQTWEFMEIFGPVTSISAHGYYETAILIDKKDLKERK